jgi:hypothetical protein
MTAGGRHTTPPVGSTDELTSLEGLWDGGGRVWLNGLVLPLEAASVMRPFIDYLMVERRVGLGSGIIGPDCLSVWESSGCCSASCDAPT